MPGKGCADRIGGNIRVERRLKLKEKGVLAGSFFFFRKLLREATDGRSYDITPFSTALASRVDAGAQAPIPFLWGDFVMTIDEFSGLLGRVIAYAIGIPLVLASLLVAYWLVVTILRLVGVIELPDPIDWLPTEWTQHLPLPT